MPRRHARLALPHTPVVCQAIKRNSRGQDGTNEAQWKLAFHAKESKTVLGESKTFAAYLGAAMKEKKVSIRDIAEETGGSYENIRRIVRGSSLPARFLRR